MFSIDDDLISNQRDVLVTYSKRKPVLLFDDFIALLSPLYANVDDDEIAEEAKGKTEEDKKKIREKNRIIKIPKSNAELLRGDFEPLYTINVGDLKSHMYYDKFPMWRQKSSKEFSLHGLGLIDNNRSKPQQQTLHDTSPHMMLGGATGHGKSVTLNDIIMAGAIVHPPWKVQFYLNDPKIVEFKKYGMHEKPMPHVNVVAATADPQYTISLLEYILDEMNVRNKIFTLAKVNNIEEFTKKTGLHLPMLVLILDEVKSMYLNAAKKASYIDTLIERFIALARNAGGRCIMASQSVVSEMSKDTMVNINIRAMLGCQPAMSTKMIGNPGASINLGTKGKLVTNTNPGNEDMKDNVPSLSPFIPNEREAWANTRPLAEVFDHLHTVARAVGYRRTENMSFYDEDKLIEQEEWQNYLTGKSALSYFFLGEPAFIYKKKYDFFSTALRPTDTKKSMLGYNLLCISSISGMRMNMIATILSNFDEIRKKEKLAVYVCSPTKKVNQNIKDLGYIVDGYSVSMDLEDAFYDDVKGIYYKQLMVDTDDKVFDGATAEGYPAWIIEKFKEHGISIDKASLEFRRAVQLLVLLQNGKSTLILGLPGLTEKGYQQYISIIQGLLARWKLMQLETKAVTESSFPVVANIFYDFCQMKGSEIKTLTAKLEQWHDVIRSGPEYGVYTFIIANPLQNSAMAIASGYKHLLFYSVTPSSINPYKIQEYWPEYTHHSTWVYTNKDLPADYCFKLKYPTIVPFGGEEE